MVKGTQNDKILSYLRGGRTLSPIEALVEFRCFRLASRINELRNKGYDITTNKDNDYAVYSLNE